MESASITERTRQQVERAQRAAEEARQRRWARRGGSLRLEGGPEPLPPAFDDDQLLDHAAD